MSADCIVCNGAKPSNIALYDTSAMVEVCGACLNDGGAGREVERLRRLANAIAKMERSNFKTVATVRDV